VLVLFSARRYARVNQQCFFFKKKKEKRSVCLSAITSFNNHVVVGCILRDPKIISGNVTRA